MTLNFQEIEKQAFTAVTELIDTAHLSKDNILVVGCSTSEITGHKIGTESSEDVAQAVFKGIYPALKKLDIFLAAQCCEHLNRAIIIEHAAVEKYNLEQVNVVPKTGAGGSFAAAAYKGFEHAVAVESVKAHAGMDIGLTLIGMHLKPVAVPVRLSINKIGMAALTFARTRPKFIGGSRAHYDETLM